MLGTNDTALLDRVHNYFSSLGGKVLHDQLSGEGRRNRNPGLRSQRTVEHSPCQGGGLRRDQGIASDHRRHGRWAAGAVRKVVFRWRVFGQRRDSGDATVGLLLRQDGIEDPAIIKQQETVMPWMACFHVDDVYGAVCDVWRVKPINKATKEPYYSNVPALLGTGGLDDACRPLYNDLIHHYFPNSQRLLFTRRVHGPPLNSLEGFFTSEGS